MTARTDRGLIAVVTRRLRAGAANLGAWIERSSYLRKWVVLGGAIGLIAGLGAVVFYNALLISTHFFLGTLAGYRVPTPAGEGNGAGSGYFARPWAIPLVVALGGLLSGVLVFFVAPEAEGHGTDAAIDAVHKNPRMIRARAVVVKIVASALTIGSGGSGGREGPTAQISAGFASLLARVLDLSPEDGRVAVSVGIGSGIGAIFGAPLGGAVLAADIVYRDDFEVEALIPGLIASVIAYTVFGLIETFSPLFGYVASSYQFHKPIQLVWFAVIGVVSGFVGLAYSRGFYAMVDLTRRLPGSRMLKPAVGGLLVGLMALAVPEVLGTGYGWVQKALGPSLASIPLWVVLLLPFARILATSLSIGSGGSGGIFGPGMVIGAFTGAAVWRLLEPIAPGIPHGPAAFVVVGMMACFGAIARAPLAVMLMVAEMTGSLTLLAPAMVAVGLAYLIVRHSDATIYRSQLKSRAEAPSQRFGFGLPMLAAVTVVQAMSAPRVVLGEQMSAAEAASRLDHDDLPGAPVIDEQGRFVGVIDRVGVSEEARHRPDTNVGRLADPTATTVPLRANLDTALEALSGVSGWATVLDAERRVRGILATSDVVTAYHGALETNLGRLSQVASKASALEERVGEDSPLVGRALRDRLLPEGCVVVSVHRANSLLFPNGDTVLRAGDVVSALVRPEQVDRIRDALLGGPAVGVAGTDGEAVGA